MVHWFIFTLSIILWPWVKVRGHSIGKQELNNCWDGRPWLKSRPELETENINSRLKIF